MRRSMLVHKNAPLPRRTMTAPSLDRDYYFLEFDNTSEAAAFVAALSRFLNSPVGSTYVDSGESVEVWSHVSARQPGRGNWVEVFLSPDALDAASAAFAPVLVSGRRSRGDLPRGSTLVIDGDRVSAWGLNEVEAILMRGRR